MKHAHRTAHRIIWLLLLPALLSFVYLAQQGKASKAPVMQSVPNPSAPGDLP